PADPAGRGTGQAGGVRRTGVTRVADAVAVGVARVRVGDGGAVVASIGNAVAVAVGLAFAPGGMQSRHGIEVEAREALETGTEVARLDADEACHGEPHGSEIERVAAGAGRWGEAVDRDTDQVSDRRRARLEGRRRCRIVG